MATFNRIDKAGISHSSLLTGYYGKTNSSEFFVGNDLSFYDFTQALTLSLMAEGYKVVIHNPASNIGFYSFIEEHLCEFYNLPVSSGESEDQGYIKKGLMTPLGPMEEVFKETKKKPSTCSKSISSHNGSICVHTPGKPARSFFKLKSTQDPFADVFAYAEKKPESKMAIIFENPGSVLLPDKKVAEIESRFSNLLKTFSIDNSQIRMIVVYPEKDLNQLINTFVGQEASPSVFYGHTIAVHLGLAGLRDGNKRTQEEMNNLSRNLFYVGTPDRDEIEHFLERKRIIDDSDCTLKRDKPFAAVVNALNSGNFKVKKYPRVANCKELVYASDEDMTIRSLNNCDFTSLVDNINTDAARKQLLGMIGLERPVKEYFDLVDQAMRLKKQGKAVRMHMEFVGPPGTGKTTTARVIGQDLRDLGLLSKGHFVEVKKADLIGEYVGESEAKTQAICEKALGGVLYIDEAYTLVGGGGSHDTGSDIYGQDALEVIMTYMEDHYDDLVVIMAGYPDEMEAMKLANRGLPSRFNKKGKISFNEYPPEVLFTIGKKRLAIESTPAFDDKLSSIIKFKFSRRNVRDWGNAREVIALTDSILNEYLKEGGTGGLDVEHIPAEELAWVDTAHMSEETIMEPLNGIIGLEDVRKNIKDLMYEVWLSHIRAQGVDGGDYGSDINLAFAFVGKAGSGKTTVARLMGQVLKNIGILENGKVETVGADKLIQGVVGETEKAVQRMFEDNVGKVVFIDEAYQLDEKVVNKITELLTDANFKGRIALILAGYPERMSRLISMNSGLASRIADHLIDFPDYTVDELWLILLSMMNQRRLSFSDQSASETRVKAWLGSLPNSDKYANGRKCEALLKEMNRGCARRLMNGQDGADPYIFLPEDIPAPLNGVTELPPQPSPAIQHFSMDLSREAETRRVSNPQELSSAVGIVEAGQGCGTGFLISLESRLVMTCCHVIENDCGHLSFRVNGLGGNPIPATPVWYSRRDDMAILQLETLPEGAMFLDIYPNGEPTVPSLTPIILCGFPYGESISRNLMINRGEINNYEKGKQLEDGRRMDIYFSAVPATHGNSGGPVLLSDTLQVIGLLQGGLKEIGPVGVRIIADIAPIYRDNNITVTNR